MLSSSCWVEIGQLVGCSGDGEVFKDRAAGIEARYPGNVPAGPSPRSGQVEAGQRCPVVVRQTVRSWTEESARQHVAVRDVRLLKVELTLDLDGSHHSRVDDAFAQVRHQL